MTYSKVYSPMKISLNTLCITLLSFYFFSQGAYSQYILVPEDSLEFKIKNIKSANSIFNASQVYYKGDKVSRIKINLKMKTYEGKRVIFDPNKFSFIDNTNKIRLRPTDVTFQNMTDFWSFTKCSKRELKKDKSRLLFKPDLEDTFFNYSPLNYTYTPQPVNYGSTKKPDLHIVFFEPKKMRNRNLHLFVLVPNSMALGSLYYGNTKLTEIHTNKL